MSEDLLGLTVPSQIIRTFFANFALG